MKNKIRNNPSLIVLNSVFIFQRLIKVKKYLLSIHFIFFATNIFFKYNMDKTANYNGKIQT